MYRPTLYSKHDQTMNDFANLFNRFPDYRHIEMRPNPVETYDNDGVFLDHLHKRKSDMTGNTETGILQIVYFNIPHWDSLSERSESLPFRFLFSAIPQKRGSRRRGTATGSWKRSSTWI